MTVREAVWESFVSVARGLAHLVSFLLRAFARSLLLVCMAVPVALPVLTLAGLDLWLAEGRELPRFDPIDIGVSFPFARVVALLVGTAIFAVVVQMMTRFAKDQARDLWAAFSCVLCKGWLPGWEIGDGFAVTWNCNFAKIPCKTKETSKSAWRLTAVLIGIVFMIVVAGPLFPEPLIKATYIFGDTISAKPEVTEQEIKKYMGLGAIFSLAHFEDAQPETAKGICIAGSEQEWLDAFRAAITSCAKWAKGPIDKDPKPVFKVTGYASVVPIRESGNSSKSARLNCKVANWRAAAVGAYLASPEKHKDRWRCDDVRDMFNRNLPNDASECGELYAGPNQNGNPFRVDVYQWSTPSEMAKDIAKDGKLLRDPRTGVEILDGTVHIEVPKGFCGTEGGLVVKRGTGTGA